MSKLVSDVKNLLARGHNRVCLMARSFVDDGQVIALSPPEMCLVTGVDGDAFVGRLVVKNKTAKIPVTDCYLPSVTEASILDRPGLLI
ncbi:MAG: hypothetical protein WCO10_00720 [bacterium]